MSGINIKNYNILTVKFCAVSKKEIQDSPCRE